MTNIFKKIFEIFKDDGSTTFFNFYKRIIKLRETGVYPFPYNLPSSISFPSDFWHEVIQIYKQTSKDGYERAISVFWADGDLIVTSVVKGSESSVTSNHSVSVKYVPHPTKKEYFRKEIYLDGKVLKRKDIYFKNAPKKIAVEYLFNMHTHPAHRKEDGSLQYSFFSLQDINSLMKSGAIVTGLVTDKLWLIVRSSDTPSEFSIEEKDINVENLKDQLKIGVYKADFNGKAIKI